MLNVAICDDENITCEQIDNMLSDISSNLSEDIEAEVFYSGEELIHDLYEGTYFDIIFLDIEIQKLNGIEVGKIIRDELNNETTQIVYISSKDSYAMELFQVRPLNFLIKPIKQEKLEHVMKDAINLLERNNLSFHFKSGNGNYKVPFSNIIYFESEGRKVNIVMKDNILSFYGKLSEIIKELNQDFILIHKSFLINYNHVIEYQYDNVKMSNDNVLSISQNNRKLVRDQLLHRKQREIL